MNYLSDTATELAREDWHAMPPEAIVADLATDPVRGLSAAEARHRLAIYGSNELVHAAAMSALSVFAQQFASFVIWILILAALVTAVMGERGEQLFDVAERERVAKIPAHGTQNQLRCRLPALEDCRSGYVLHGLFSLPASPRQSCNTSAFALERTCQFFRSEEHTSELRSRQ